MRASSSSVHALNSQIPRSRRIALVEIARRSSRRSRAAAAQRRCTRRRRRRVADHEHEADDDRRDAARARRCPCGSTTGERQVARDRDGGVDAAHRALHREGVSPGSGARRDAERAGEVAGLAALTVPIGVPVERRRRASRWPRTAAAERDLAADDDVGRFRRRCRRSPGTALSPTGRPATTTTAPAPPARRCRQYVAGAAGPRRSRRRGAPTDPLPIPARLVEQQVAGDEGVGCHLLVGELRLTRRRCLGRRRTFKPGTRAAAPRRFDRDLLLRLLADRTDVVRPSCRRCSSTRRAWSTTCPCRCGRLAVAQSPAYWSPWLDRRSWPPRSRAGRLVTAARSATASPRTVGLRRSTSCRSRCRSTRRSRRAPARTTAIGGDSGDPGPGSAMPARPAAQHGSSSAQGVPVTEVTSHASLLTLMLSTTAVTVQVTCCCPLYLRGVHFTTNAVPSTAAVVPPAFTSNDPVSETLAARFQVSPTDERALRLAAALLVGELGDGEDGGAGEPRQRAVGVVDLRPAVGVGLDRCRPARAPGRPWRRRSRRLALLLDRDAAAAVTLRLASGCRLGALPPAPHPPHQPRRRHDCQCATSTSIGTASNPLRVGRAVRPRTRLTRCSSGPRSTLPDRDGALPIAPRDSVTLADSGRPPLARAAVRGSRPSVRPARPARPAVATGPGSRT